MNKKEAAEYLGISIRSIERLSKPGPDQRLTPTHKRGSKGQVEAVYEAEQLERLKEEREKPFTLVRPQAPDTPRQATVATPDGDAATMVALTAIEKSLRKLEPQKEEPLSVPLSERLWLTIPEAAAYSGLGKEALERAIKDGSLKAPDIGPKGSRVINRKALKRYSDRLAE